MPAKPPSKWFLGADLGGKDYTGVAKMAIGEGKPVMFDHFTWDTKEPEFKFCDDDCPMCRMGVVKRYMKPVTITIQVWTRRRQAWVDGEAKSITATVIMPITGGPAVAWIEEAIKAQEDSNGPE